MKNRLAEKRPERARKIYVKVESSFDETGYMQPKSLIWGNRVLPIDSVIDFRPAEMVTGQNIPGDCYTVVIRGEEKHLFFEKDNSFHPAHFGRWFVESIQNE